MQAVHVLQVSSMSFHIPAHQNMLPSVEIFFDPLRSKCGASTTCFLSSSGTTILSLTNSRPNRSVSSVKTVENSSGACSFRLFRKQIFNCSNFGSIEVLWIVVFKFTMRLISAFLRFSSVSAFTFFDFSIKWFTWI